MNQETLQDRQRQIEQDSLSLGIARYRAEQPAPWQSEAHRREEPDLAPGKLLLKKYVEPVAEGLEAFIEWTESGRAGRKSPVAPYLAHIDALQAAYLALRNAINGAADNSTFALTARRIGDAIHEHMEMLAMAKDHPGLYRKLSRQLAKSTSAKHRLNVLRHVRRKYDLAALNWSTKDRIQIGAKMIELILEATPLFEIRQMSRGKNDRPQYLKFTPETVEWLEKTHGRCELLSPIHLPMVCPPRKWRTPYSGGYLTDILKPRLVRTRNRAHLDELGGVDLTNVMSAVNAIQETPWQINVKVLEVLEEEMARGGDPRLGLPWKEDRALPPKPATIVPGVRAEDLSAAGREDLAVWKAEAAKVHNENAKNEQEKIVLAQKLYVAHRFRDEEAIYFPHYLDFRGRVYPMASYLNPQGDDVAKGLLQFGRGKPLGEDGAFWLAVHLAGLWGVDKVSFEDRQAWVREHEEAILASAMDPHDDGAFWRTAEKPFQALAACIDWLGYKVSGDEHVSYLPIAMDGSCSGLQHYSALLRDEVGGAAVNLVPGEKPADIYSMVAERAQTLSDGFQSETKAEMQKAWAGKFCRKVAKQPTMTLCYSATKFGMKGQIENALKKLGEEAEDGVYLNGGVDPYRGAIYAADVVWEALGDTVVAARSAMDWLKKVAEVVTEADLPLRWTSPIGLPVLQDYRGVSGRRVVVHVGGRRITLTVQEEQANRAAGRQASGIAPNFVHSLDASHLLATVNLAAANGIHDFAMIHDSFGCHAADTTLLNAVLRETFVAQYEDLTLEKVREEVVAQVVSVDPGSAEKIPPVPATGSLDLQAVRDSEFFFA